MSESEVNLLQWSRKNRWKVVGVLEEDGVTGNGGNSSYMESFIKTDVPFEGCEGIMGVSRGIPSKNAWPLNKRSNI